MFGISFAADSLMSLSTVGPSIRDKLAKVKIDSIADLICYFPSRYEFRGKSKKIADLNVAQFETIIADVISARAIFAYRRKFFEVRFADESANIQALWFQANIKYLKERFSVGSRWIVQGKVSANRRSIRQFIHPETVKFSEKEALENEEQGESIVPIYPLTEGVSQNRIRKLINIALLHLDKLEDYLPERINDKYNLPTLHESISRLHNPSINEDVAMLNDQSTTAHKKLIFNELFLTQLALANKRAKERSSMTSIPFTIDKLLQEKVSKIFPFSLTKGQSNAVSEIISDLRSGFKMNRMIQGDVGSGKSAVAIATILFAVANRRQAVIMAPTEILANQHYNNLQKFLLNYQPKLRVELLTSAVKNKKSIISRIANNEVDITIGTHALIQDGVEFMSLGVAVIDEQQRFGVLQRAKLTAVGDDIHTLIMSATPIPRTLAMTAYGDLDITRIEDSPPGRKRIITKVFQPSDSDAGFEIIREEAKENHQTYIVCPLIEENEKLELKAAESIYESYKNDLLANLKVALIHGRMPSTKKDEIVQDFVNRKIDVLVSTTVVEVGMDAPFATVMMIENPEQFGLAQLHQLRGRVGRSKFQSYCLLMASNNSSANPSKKLQAMENYFDGFNIAEQDLILRGAGDILGVKQSGIADFKLADLVKNQRALVFARGEAQGVIESDPELLSSENQHLREALKKYNSEFKLAKVG
ncbi:MAG: ATP-dependent DNA helicase RecG [Nitrospinota bacterium]